MKEEHHPTWIKLRAEVIKHFHDTENEGKFKNGFSMAMAIKLAEVELKTSLKSGDWILTIEEMLLHSLDKCVIIAQSRIRKKIMRFINM
jgi:hypothetical protein